MTKKEELIKSLKEMREYGQKSFGYIIKDSIYTIKPSKRRLIIIIFMLIILIYPIYACITSLETIKGINKMVEISNSIILPLFGIVFTGYTLFQALIDGNALRIMFVSRVGKNSMFKNYNLYFFAMSCMYISILTLNYILSVTLNIVDFKTIYLYIDENIRYLISGIFIPVYVGINLFAIIEVKSFIFNLFNCFNISAVSRMIGLLNDYDDNLRKK